MYLPNARIAHSTLFLAKPISIICVTNGLFGNAPRLLAVTAAAKPLEEGCCSSFFCFFNLLADITPSLRSLITTAADAIEFSLTGVATSLPHKSASCFARFCKDLSMLD